MCKLKIRVAVAARFTFHYAAAKGSVNRPWRRITLPTACRAARITASFSLRIGNRGNFPLPLLDQRGQRQEVVPMAAKITVNPHHGTGGPSAKTIGAGLCPPPPCLSESDDDQCGVVGSTLSNSCCNWATTSECVRPSTSAPITPKNSSRDSYRSMYMAM